MTKELCNLCGVKQESFLEIDHIDYVDRYKIEATCRWVCKVCDTRADWTFVREYYSNDDKEMFPDG